MSIDLPISKSMAQRLLLLQAIHGDELMPVSDTMATDIQLLFTNLQISTFPHFHIDLSNAATALRFLTAYYAQLPDGEVVLGGCERMHHRPIGQLVDALRQIGADITYLGEKGYPPIRICGKTLDKSRPLRINHPDSTQFISALLLIGVPVQTDDTSPYITMTRQMIAQYPNIRMEYDWSAAAFWYEYIALHGGELHLNGLHATDLQGDKQVADLFLPLGVTTHYDAEGITIKQDAVRSNRTQSFSSTPDLYPAVYMTCEKLGIHLEATGLERLPLKESDRLQSLATHTVNSDHRIAMALLAADYSLHEADIACIHKSYPLFYEQLCQVRLSK